MLTEKDYCDLDTSHELWMMGLEPDTYYDGPIILLYEAQKFLREEKGIFVYIDVPWKTDDGLGWSYFCCNRPMTEEDKEVCFASGGLHDSYEDALLEGVKSSVQYLKKIDD